MKKYCKGKKIWIYVIYIVLTFILLVRARYSFCWTDEAFYISTVNRFLDGDRIITDEWYLSQLFSIILYPVVLVYKFFVGSLEGIYLFCRILYVLIQTAITFFTYKVMNKKGIDSISSFLFSLVIMFYCKAYIITLSYYSVIFFTFVLLLIFLYDYEGGKFLKGMLIGICISIITLINPYFMGVYVLALLILLAANIYRSKVNSKILKKINFLFISSGIGILICIVSVGIIVLRNNSISDIVRCIPIIINENGYNHSLLWKVLSALLYVIIQYRYTVVFMGIILFYSLFLLWKEKLTEIQSLIIFLCSFIIFVINCLDSRNWNGGIQTAFAFFGLQSLVLSEKRNWKIFIHFYIPGLIMGVMMSLSSDTAFNAMTLGFAISGGISCIFVYDYIKQYKNKFVYGIGIISICIVVIIPAIFRIYVVYRDSELPNLKAKITAGPAKGLYTTYEHKEQYEEVLEVMQVYCSREGMVFISSWCPWAYLCTNMKCGAYTTWNLKMENNEEKLMKYYELYPERIPDIIIELNDEVGKIDVLDKFPDIEWLSTKPQADSKRDTSFLWKYLKENSYEKIPVKCGTVYISP